MKSEKRIRKITQDFAKRMDVKELPISLEKLEEIATKNNWKILSFKSKLGEKIIKTLNLEIYTKTTKGFAYVSDDYKIIFFKDDLEYLEKISVICHEMGHFVLRHINTNICCKNKHISKRIRIKQEIEADIFALELQAPTYLMKSMYLDTAKKLYDEGILCKSDSKKQALYFYSTKITRSKILITISIILLLIFNLYYIYNQNKNSASFLNNRIEIVTQNFTELITQTETSIVITETITELTTTEAIESTTPQSNKTVIVTKTGKKYHLPTCYHIANKSTLIEMDIKKAEDLGYKPCATCKPQ